MIIFINIILTVGICYLTYLIYKVYTRIEWLTGAMETHSATMLLIEAARGTNGRPIKTVAWDPTIKAPPIKRVHGEEFSIDTIYIYLPPDQRKNKPTKRMNLR